VVKQRAQKDAKKNEKASKVSTKTVMSAGDKISQVTNAFNSPNSNMGGETPPNGNNGNVTAPPSASNKIDASVREHITALLERWLRVWKGANEQVFQQYLQLMHQYGVLKTEESANRFFRLATELCVEACQKSARPPASGGDGGSQLSFTVMDALSKLFLFLLRLADKEAGDVVVRVNLLNRILTAIARVLIDDHEEKKNSKKLFDQRPYLRLLSELMVDLGTNDPKTQEPSPNAVPLLTVYNQLFMLLAPGSVPGFAFAWLQLISSKHFMPQLLAVKDEKGWPYLHRLLLSLLVFLQRFLKGVQMTDAIRKLYKGTLRVLLVLLHDFPEFLCDYQLSLCDVIPHTCVQLRNLVLSAFPRSMRLPDPFTQNLKVSSLPEISQPPRMLPDYASALGGTVRQRLDTYLTTKQPVEFPSLLPQILATPGPNGIEYNIPIMNLLAVYIGTQAVRQMQGTAKDKINAALKDSPGLTIFNHLLSVLDIEGRYLLLNSMANQLRYPNNLTHYFSSVMLLIFSQSNSEYLQEQVTRVLLERLIVHRPHPWGLLITFIELIKNPEYAFWRRGFTKFAPEIEKVFESVARLCLGTQGKPDGAAAGAIESNGKD